jgi:hypothetical protein
VIKISFHVRNPKRYGHAGQSKLRQTPLPPVRQQRTQLYNSLYTLLTHSSNSHEDPEKMSNRDRILYVWPLDKWGGSWLLSRGCTALIWEGRIMLDIKTSSVCVKVSLRFPPPVFQGCCYDNLVFLASSALSIIGTSSLESTH